MKLYIDTTDRNKIKISIIKNNKEIISKEDSVGINSDSLLELLEKTLRQASLTTSDITEIGVERGPGSYTGARIGVTVANTLSFALQIPVNGKRLSRLENPIY